MSSRGHSGDALTRLKRVAPISNENATVMLTACGLRESGMDGVAMTAYYCCGARAEDASSPRPICGDHLAERLTTPEAKAYYRASKKFPNPKATNGRRARIIDYSGPAPPLSSIPSFASSCSERDLIPASFRLSGEYCRPTNPPLIAANGGPSRRQSRTPLSASASISPASSRRQTGTCG